MRTGPPCGVRSTAAVEFSCGWLTHAAASRKQRSEARFIIRWLYHNARLGYGAASFFVANGRANAAGGLCAVVAAAFR